MTRHDRVLAVVTWLAFVAMAAISGPGVADEPGHPGHRHMAQAKPAARPSSRRAVRIGVMEASCRFVV